MSFNSTTKTIAYWLLGLWGLYIFLKRGLIGLLISGAIGMVAAAFVPKIEVITGIVILGGFAALILLNRIGCNEPFMDSPKNITERIARLSKEPQVKISSSQDEIHAHTPLRVSGVYDVSIEGFEDASPSKDKDGMSSSSQPALKEILGSLSPELKKQISDTVQNLTEKKESFEVKEKSESNSQLSGKTQESPFRSDPAGLFKLGEIPTESKDGPIIDAGATFMKALQALDPTQIKSMTEDTAKMVDAQKNLIGLLNTMKPILQDGQKLMSTFTSVLGQPGGIAGAAL